MLRFAPSPTGDMHIGNLRAAILNYIIAKQNGEGFLIRIEDTDIERNIAGKDTEILEILEKFGISWDKLIYQSANFPHHRDIAKRLIDEGKAFYCYCTKEFLAEKKSAAIAQGKAFRYEDSWADACKAKNPKPVIRLKGAWDSISFTDEIKGKCEFSANEIDSFVIMREDSTPTYNFACALDDISYEISYIIRGEDHTSNTPKQLLIRACVGEKRLVKFAHLPIILNIEGKKMSKRENESSVKWLLGEGYLPQAIANYLLSMGNKPKSEIFTLGEAIAWFDIHALSKSPVRFDIAQLRHINRAHLRQMEARNLAELLGFDDENIGHLAKIYLEEASTINELKAKISRIFAPKIYEDSARDSTDFTYFAQAWKETFELESIEQDFIPRLPKELEGLFDGGIHLKAGSLRKLEKRAREEFLPFIKPTLESPHIVFTHNNAYIFTRDIGKGSVLFASVAKSDNGEWIISTNSLKRINTLKNKLNNEGAEVIYVSREAPNILVEAFNAKPFLGEPTSEIIARIERKCGAIDEKGGIYADSTNASDSVDSKDSARDSIESTESKSRDFVESATFVESHAQDSTKSNDSAQNSLESLREILTKMLDSNDENLTDFASLKRALMSASGLNGKALFQPLRFLLTGAHKGPHLDEIYPHLRPYLRQIIRKNNDS